MCAGHADCGPSPLAPASGPRDAAAIRTPRGLTGLAAAAAAAFAPRTRKLGAVRGAGAESAPAPSSRGVVLSLHGRAEQPVGAQRRLRADTAAGLAQGAGFHPARSRPRAAAAADRLAADEAFSAGPTCVLRDRRPRSAGVPRPDGTAVLAALARSCVVVCSATAVGAAQCGCGGRPCLLESASPGPRCSQLGSCSPLLS